MVSKMFLVFFVLQLSLVYCRIYDKCTLARELLYKYHFPRYQISTWICIVSHESQFNTAAINTKSHDNGLFQISQLYWCDPPSHPAGCNVPCERFRDDNIDDDVQCVKKIFNEFQAREYNGFRAWTTYYAYCSKDYFNMWMLYSSEHWPKAISLESAVERISSHLQDLATDALHSTNYDLSICWDEEAVARQNEAYEKYNSGSQLCRQFLDCSFDVETFCEKIAALGLVDFLECALPYISEEIKKKYGLEEPQQTDADP